jgi:hypothetical protein
MPISNQQAEKAYKKLQGLALTGSGRYTFNEPFYAPIAINPQQIWLEQGLIPQTAPTLVNNAVSGVVQRIIGLSLTPVDGTSNSFYSNTLKDAIPSSFGTGYTITLTDNNNTTIDLGTNDWEVDTEAGVLTFFGINGNSAAPANMPPKISFYKYIGAKGNSVVYLEQTGGGANTYTFTTQSITNYTSSAVYILKVSASNTASSTLKLNSLPAKPVKKSTDTGLAVLEAGDLVAGINYLLTFDKANDCFQIVSGSGGSGSSNSNGMAVVDIETANWTTLSTSPVTYSKVINYNSLGLEVAGSVEIYENTGTNQYKLAVADVLLDTVNHTLTITSYTNVNTQVRILGSGAGSANSGSDSGTPSASSVTFTPSGSIVATNVQTAITELDTEKAPLSHAHTFASLTSKPTSLSGYGILDTVVKSVNSTAPDSNGNVVVNAYTKQESDGKYALSTHSHSNYLSTSGGTLSGALTTTSVNTSANGTGENVKIGDDVWLGDINQTNTMLIKGVATPTDAYIIFGTGDVKKLGRSGTGALTYEGDFTANNVSATSDARLKTNIRTFDDGLTKVMMLKPSVYDRLDSTSKDEIGFIAQEVQQIAPSLIIGNETLSLDYSRLTVILTKAIQEQQSQIEELKEEIKKLKGL